MGDFRGNRFGGNRNFGNRDFGGRSSGPREMFRTTCSKCGKDCEVPFKPTGMKPVYCSDCFDKNGRGASDSRRFDDRSPRRPNFEPRGDQSLNRQELGAINAKLDKILSILSPVAYVKKEEKPSIELDEITMPEEKMVEESIQSEAPAPKKKKKATKISTPTPEE